MKKIFAVFLFLSFLCGCSSFKNFYYSKTSLFAKDNLIYSTKGDFDGDKRKEQLTIVKETNKSPELIINDESSIYSKEININTHNLNTIISDVNKDKHDDIIILDNDNGVSNIFVYTLAKDIHTIFSSETVKQIINFKKIDDGYLISGGSFEKFIKSKDNLGLKFYLSEFDDSGDMPIITCQGTISTNEGLILSTVTVQFIIDGNGNTITRDLQVNPYKEINI